MSGTVGILLLVPQTNGLNEILHLNYASFCLPLNLTLFCLPSGDITAYEFVSFASTVVGNTTTPMTVNSYLIPVDALGMFQSLCWACVDVIKLADTPPPCLFLAGVIMAVRFYLMARFIRNHSGYYGSQIEFVGTMNNGMPLQAWPGVQVC